jgi:hypothetical protein
MTEATGEEQDREEFDLLLRGFQVSRMLRLVADLGIADRIARDASVPVRDLAAACAVLPEQLIRVLRALASFGVFKATAEGRVAHSARSLLMRRDTPKSLHYAARFWTGPGSWRAWGELDAALTGGTPHDAAWNMGRFAYLREHPDEARAFDAMMANSPDDRHAAFAEAYDFSAADLIADIGGGNGAALRHILARFPKPRAVLFDLEDVVGVLTPKDCMAGRIDPQGGDFFERVPAGADLYLLVLVLHDWSDEDCLRILRTCRATMGEGARLLLGEQVLEPDPEHGRQVGYLMDMQMMAMFGQARERTEAEFRGLLEQAGFSLTKIVPTASLVSLIEATPVARTG